MPLPLLAIGALAVKGVAWAAKKTGKGIAFGAKKSVPLLKAGAKYGAAGVAIEAGGRMIGAGQSFIAGRGASSDQLPQLSGLPYPASGTAAGAMPVIAGQQLPQTLALNHPSMRVYYRAPKGYVIIRDPRTNQPAMAMLKRDARAMHLWKPKPKPPISIRDWHSFQAAKRVEKKLRKIAGPSLRKYAAHHSGYCKKHK